MSVQMAQIDIHEAQVNDIIKAILNREISKSDAAALAVDWVRERTKKKKRTFNYATAFPEADTACGSKFTRIFEHQDWVDGESIVQAEKTSAERGFNERFHDIETDIDHVFSEIGKAFACLADMRDRLYHTLNEIRTEINQINSDIFEYCIEQKPSYSGPSLVGPNVMDIGKLVGVTKFQDKDYIVYDVGGRIEMYPTVSSSGITGGLGLTTDDIRVTGAGDLARILQDDEEIQRYFKGRKITKKAMVEKFGGRTVREGVTIAAVVGSLLDNVVYKSMDKLVDAVAEQGASSVRKAGESERIEEQFGVNVDVKSIADAPVSRMAGITADINKSLVSGGLDTIGKVAAAGSRKVKQVLGKLGRDVSDGEVSAILANARTLTKIR